VARYTFLRQLDEERITQPQAVAPDASVTPTAGWLCVPTRRNDQLIYVAPAKGIITGPNGSGDLG
jgi:hypothetical protein